MDFIIMRFFLAIIILIVGIGMEIIQWKKENKNFKIVVLAIILSLATFGSNVWNDIPAPDIGRKADYSAVVLSTAEPMKIEYQISTSKDSDKWITYDGPFPLEQGAVIYARAKVLGFTGEKASRDVSVTSDGLVYFSDVEKPSDIIEEIRVEYKYRDPDKDGHAGNYYAGYKIKKSDLTVIGIDTEGEEKTITDFEYTPKMLNAGDNDIRVIYTGAGGKKIEKYISIHGNNPALIQLNAQYIGDKKVQVGAKLDSGSFKVTGKLEDGTIEQIKEYSISPVEMKEGDNNITIEKDGFLYETIIHATNPDSVVKEEVEPNNKIEKANKIGVNKNYSGKIKDEDDIDYYKFTLNEKQKVWIDFEHKKISDDEDPYWYITIFDDSSEQLLQTEVKGSNTKTICGSLRLPKGSYYVRIETGYKSSKSKYTFCVHAENEQQNTETENNGDYNSATEISVGSSIVGNLQSSEDIDFYKFYLSNTRDIKITFHHSQSDLYDDVWHLELRSATSSDALKDSEEHSSMDIAGNSAENISSQWNSLSPGVYYIKVTKGFFKFSNDDYKITLS